MAPTLIESYTKDLSEWPHTGATRFIRFGFLLVSTSLFKVSEYQILKPEDDIVRYILIERVGVNISNAEFSNLILDLEDDGLSEQRIIRALLNSGALDYDQNVIVARVGLRNYSFVESGQSVDCFQVAGAYTQPKNHQKGIMSRTYLFLLNWYEHLVCDDMQTIPGARIWAGPIIRAGEVRIYNEKGESFEDVLGEKGMGKHTGFLPWNKGRLHSTDSWEPNKLQTTVQKFIVLVMSRSTCIKIGYVPLDSVRG